MEGTRLALIRHGESRAQVDRVVAGHAGCLGLSERGRRQAEALGRRLAETRELGEVAAVYTSVMPRAIETAEILAGALDWAAVERHCDLCEHHPGDTADGLSWDEADRRFPPIEPWDPDARRTPNGESHNEMAARVARGLDALVDRHPGQTVVVVCHGGVVAHSLLRWFELSVGPDASRRGWFVVENTAITEWRYGPVPFDRHGAGWQLVRFNDFAHLGGNGLLGQ